MMRSQQCNAIVRTGLCALFSFLCLLLAACDRQPRQVTLTGDTMGTTYHVTLVDWPESVERDRVHLAIEGILKQIDYEMSNYSDDSMLAAFNRTPPGQWFDVPPDLHAIVRVALDVSAATGGAYDITVPPLLDAWGFGPKHTGDASQPVHVPPDAPRLAAAMARTGWQYLEWREQPPALRKQRDIELDLSSIAPGYAADRIAAMLEAQGIHRYLVDVGGELRVNGANAEGKPWVIGIEDPRGITPGQVRQPVSLRNGALATSGNYRQFFEWEGKHYSHTIDPRTGEAVSHGLVSVTVLAPTGAAADAWATAFAVLGADATLALAEQRQMPVYLQVQRGEALDVMMSAPMRAILEAAR